MSYRPMGTSPAWILNLAKKPYVIKDSQTALHDAVGAGHVGSAQVLLQGGGLEMARDSKGCRPACLIDRKWAENNPSQDMRMRYLLARGPAFRARLWLWSTNSTKGDTMRMNDGGGGGGSDRNAGHGGAGKKTLIPWRCFRRRREGGGPGEFFMTTMLRYVHVTGEGKYANGVRAWCERLCDRGRFFSFVCEGQVRFFQVMTRLDMITCLFVCLFFRPDVKRHASQNPLQCRRTEGGTF